MASYNNRGNAWDFLGNRWQAIEAFSKALRAMEGVALPLTSNLKVNFQAFGFEGERLPRQMEVILFASPRNCSTTSSNTPGPRTRSSNSRVTATAPTPKPPAHPLLTAREKEVLALIAEGCTNTQIAEKLFISPLTVDSHRKNLPAKFAVKNTATMVKLAFDHGLL